MAKAILGHMGGVDPRIQAQLISDNRRLRQQVTDLEALVLRLRAENDALVASHQHADLLTLDEIQQPA